MTKDSAQQQPVVWAVVLGYNHVEDTLECLASLARTTYRPFEILYVDNGSEPDVPERVREQAPGCHVLRLEPNAGVAGGFNAGLAHALEQGADYVVIFNNDTTADPALVERLVAAAVADPGIGMAVPKIYYYDHPDTIWSAGSVFRRFPPVVYMRKTRSADDGRFDQPQDLDYATFCVILFSRALLEQAGLMDPDYHFLYEDYDLCLRAREAGFRIRYAPDAHARHKISKTTGAGTNNPKFWRTYGRSEAIFTRKFRRYRWLTGWTHALYIVLRFLAEGNPYGWRPYLAGWRQGAREPLHPPPALGDPRVVRGRLQAAGPSPDSPTKRSPSA